MTAPGKRLAEKMRDFYFPCYWAGLSTSFSPEALVVKVKRFKFPPSLVTLDLRGAPESEWIPRHIQESSDTLTFFFLLVLSYNLGNIGKLWGAVRWQTHPPPF